MFVLFWLQNIAVCEITANAPDDTMICKPGYGFSRNQQRIINSGSCGPSNTIETEEECKMSAEFYKNYGEGGGESRGYGGKKSLKLDPHGCLLSRLENRFFLNVKPTSKRLCNKMSLCVCKTLPCQRCTKSHYSVGGHQAECQPCPKGKRFTLNNLDLFTSKEACTVNESDMLCKAGFEAVFPAEDVLMENQKGKCKKCQVGTYNDVPESVNPKCKTCEYQTNQARTKCISAVDQLHVQNNIIGQIAKTLSASKNAEFGVNSGQITRLQRMWATAEVRKNYDEMRLKHASQYQKHDEHACRHEEKAEYDGYKRHIHVFSAVQLNEEINENTCLSTNRDELITSICNFASKFDETLADYNIQKKAKDFWPNICCSPQGEICKPPAGIPEEKMVPFALAQGGKVTKASLYGEILDILRAKNLHHPKGGYLLNGMLDVLNEVMDVNTEDIRLEITRVFSQIHLCGPKVFNSPRNDAIKLCQLFHPYGQLMDLFHKKFIGLFRAKDAAIILQAQKASTTSFIQTMAKMRKSKRGKRGNKGPDVCRLKLASEDEVNEKKKVFCSMYQPFDATDENRITNVAMFYIREDIGHDEKFVKALSRTVRFVTSDKCFYNSPMFTGNDFSLQSIELYGKKEWILVARLDTSPNGYLRTDAENCDGKYLPRVTLTFGIYADINNCCEKTKNAGNCQRCSSKNAPKALDHHWTKEKLFYEVAVTGNTFKLQLDGNPILAGTKFTYLEKTNTVRPQKEGASDRLLQAISKTTTNNNRRRRLLGWSAIWNQFTSNVETTQGTCNNNILRDVTVNDNGVFSFKCDDAAALCSCIQHVGVSGEEQHFGAGNVDLNVYRQDGFVGYEITEDGNPISYGDVNAGRVRSIRRRLLQDDDFAS